MRKSIFIFAVCMMMLTNGSIIARAEEGGGDHNSEWRQHMEDQMQKFFDDLNLSQEQKNLLEENRKNHREQMGTLRKNMREWRLQMQEELQKSDLDMPRINDLQGKIKEAQGKMLDYRLEGILTVHKILTPEQYKEFSKQMKQCKDTFRRKIGERFGKTDDILQDPAEMRSEKSE